MLVLHHLAISITAISILYGLLFSPRPQDQMTLLKRWKTQTLIKYQRTQLVRKPLTRSKSKIQLHQSLLMNPLTRLKKSNSKKQLHQSQVAMPLLRLKKQLHRFLLLLLLLLSDSLLRNNKRRNPSTSRTCHKVIMIQNRL
jgi:hypothetical protein